MPEMETLEDIVNQLGLNFRGRRDFLKQIPEDPANRQRIASALQENKWLFEKVEASFEDESDSFENEIARIKNQIAKALGAIAIHAPNYVKPAAKLFGKYESYRLGLVYPACRHTAEKASAHLGKVISKLDSMDVENIRDVALSISTVIGKSASNLDVYLAALDKYEGHAARAVSDTVKIISNELYYSDCQQGLESIFPHLDALADPDKYIEFQKSLLPAPDAFFRFNKSYVLDSTIPGLKFDEAANQRLYEQGLDLIRQIKKGSIPLVIRMPFLMHTPAREFREELTELGNAENGLIHWEAKLKESRGRDENAKAHIAHHKQLIRKYKNLLVEETRTYLKDSYSIEELKEELNQLSQHRLSGKPAQKATEISRNLMVAEDEIKADSIEISVLPKSFANMPTYDEYRCCAFPGYKSKFMDLYAGYLLNPAIQLVQLKAGDKSAIAITAYTKSGAPGLMGNQKILLVDSFESKSHLFARKIVSDIALQGLLDYAKACDFDALLVSGACRNPASQKFYDSIQRPSTVMGLCLPIDFPKPYLEYNVHDRVPLGIRNSRKSMGKLIRLKPGPPD